MIMGNKMFKNKYSQPQGALTPGQGATGATDPHMSATASRSAGGMQTGIPTYGAETKPNVPVIGSPPINPSGGDVGTQGLENLGAKNPAINPFLDRQIEMGQRRLTEGFNRDVLPGLVSHFANTGNLDSSAHALALGRAGTGLSQTLADYDTGLRFGAYESDANRQFGALGQLSGQEFSGDQNQRQRDFMGEQNQQQRDFLGKEGDLSRRYSLFNNQQNRDLQSNLGLAQLGIQQQQINANLMVNAGIMSRQNADLALQAAEWLQVYGQAKSADDKRRFEEETGANYDYAMYLRQLLGNAPGVGGSENTPGTNISVGPGAPNSENGQIS